MFGSIYWFNIKSGLKRGNVLSPFLFNVTMEEITGKVSERNSWKYG